MYVESIKWTCFTGTVATDSYKPITVAYFGGIVRWCHPCYWNRRNCCNAQFAFFLKMNLKCSKKSHLEHLKILQMERWADRLHSWPHWGTLQHSYRRINCYTGSSLHLPNTILPLRPFGLRQLPSLANPIRLWTYLLRACEVWICIKVGESSGTGTTLK